MSLLYWVKCIQCNSAETVPASQSQTQILTGYHKKDGKSSHIATVRTHRAVRQTAQLGSHFHNDPHGWRMHHFQCCHIQVYYYINIVPCT